MPNGRLPAEHWERRLKELEEEVYPKLSKDVADQVKSSIESSKKAADKCDFRGVLLSVSNLDDALFRGPRPGRPVSIPTAVTLRDTVIMILEETLMKNCACKLI